VETLVLENTIEHAIFNHAKNMSRADLQRVNELEDDAGIIKIIQNAQILPVDDGEGKGLSSFALLDTPQQVFGRPNRDKYHRYGTTEAQTAEKPPKKPKISKKGKTTKKDNVEALDTPVAAGSTMSLPIHGSAPQLVPSIFGGAQGT
jgi:hypothetical protein